MISKKYTSKLLGYSNADFLRCPTERQSISGTCYLLNCLMPGAAKNQNCAAQSTVEAEYVVVGSCCAQLPWTKQILDDYGLKLKKCPYIL